MYAQTKILKGKKVAIKACGYRGYLHVTSKNEVLIRDFFELMVHMADLLNREIALPSANN